MSEELKEFSLNVLVALTRKLTELVTRESDLLKQMKVSEIALLQKEKNEVAGLLEKQQNYLKSDASTRDNLSHSDRALLKKVAVEFDESIKVYQQELFKAQKINELVIGKMVDVLKDHVLKNRSYNRRGTKISSGMELAMNTPALKFNSQV